LRQIFFRCIPALAFTRLVLFSFFFPSATEIVAMPFGYAFYRAIDALLDCVLVIP